MNKNISFVGNFIKKMGICGLTEYSEYIYKKVFYYEKD